MYMIGDKCRQYAYCNNAGGACTLVKTAGIRCLQKLCRTVRGRR